jgi:hypothetical protein
MSFKEGIIRSAEERLATICEMRVQIVRTIEDIDTEAGEIRDMLKVLGVKNPLGVTGLVAKHKAERGPISSGKSKYYVHKSRRFLIKEAVCRAIIDNMKASKEATFENVDPRICLECGQRIREGEIVVIALSIEGVFCSKDCRARYLAKKGWT